MRENHAFGRQAPETWVPVSVCYYCGWD